MPDIAWAHHERDPEAYRAITEYVTRRIWGRARAMPLGTAMAVTDEGGPLGAALVYDFDSDAGACQISAAAESPRWLNRTVLRQLFSYCFDQLGCGVVVMRSSPSNKRLLRITKAYGFSQHTIPDLGGKGRPETLHILTDDAWRHNGFHKEIAHGQETTA